MRVRTIEQNGGGFSVRGLCRAKSHLFVSGLDSADKYPGLTAVENIPDHVISLRVVV